LRTRTFFADFFYLKVIAKQEEKKGQEILELGL
jgi:hypothetical protein